MKYYLKFFIKIVDILYILIYNYKYAQDVHNKYRKGDIVNLEYLRECRKKKFKTQRLASESMDISFEMYRSIELGRRIGTIDTIAKICKALDMDANILLNLK